MIPPDELRHLFEGSRRGEIPGGPLVEVMVGAPSGAGILLDRCRAVLAVVLPVSEPDWPDLDGWRQRLPDWFIDGCAPERSEEESARWLTWWRSLKLEDRMRAAIERPWTLSDWLAWMEPADRQWFWWDGNFRHPGEARVVVQVPGWPFALESLRWLLQVAGGDPITITDDPVG